ncbi:hypothetical protein [Psychrobacillus lasiicapitis]|uniref:DUF3169 family protein n=1 Tax=Psychrobacillus lasiicapitis TaxID=1636719 RepID=A0A544T8Y5_9BACI|nr:hypothetical protein [Psychrobacillus lasiicapitis]TQR13919.1 hypothetical protein FG382_09940 [Psychrobacillus lasiicapitis]GGA36627.1 hypothetical protein GCM10011384_27810 [Psychrobacillus lasiicapitis]
MKKDFRVQYPLWQISFMLIFFIIAFIISGATTSYFNDKTSFSYSIQLEALEGGIMFLIIPVYLIMMIILSSKVSKYNKEHPTKKISVWRTKPLEYLEDDEAWQMITRAATQKVYTFFTWSLPLSAVFHLIIPTTKLLIILNIVILSLVQYLIFYVHVRKHVTEEEG